MQLLKKSEASREIKIERKQQIDEGVNIAKRVDSLRDTLQALETQYQNFAATKQESLKELLGGLEKEIITRRSEVEILEVRKSEALKPITAELAVLEEKRKISLETDNALADRESRIIEHERRIEEEKKEIEKAKVKISLELGKLAQKDEDTTKRFQESLDLSQEITRKEAESDEKIKAENKIIVDIKAGLAVTERHLQIREKHLDTREDDINKRQIRLEDREGVLARNLKRTQPKK